MQEAWRWLREFSNFQSVKTDLWEETNLIVLNGLLGLLWTDHLGVGREKLFLSAFLEVFLGDFVDRGAYSCPGRSFARL